MMGYDERLYVENFPEMNSSHDDYANYLKAEGQESPCKLLTQDGVVKTVKVPDKSKKKKR